MVSSPPMDIAARRRPRAPQPGPVGQVPGSLKPSSPLLAGICVGLKPPSPLRGRNGRLWRIFRAQRCPRFQWARVGGEQWCRGFQVSDDRRLQRRHWFHMPVACPVDRACVPTGVPGAGGPGHCVCRWAAARPRCPARPRHRPPARRQVPPAPSAPTAPGVQARSVGSPRPRRRLLRPERSGLKPCDLALHSGVVSAKIIVSTPTWRVIRPSVR